MTTILDTDDCRRHCLECSVEWTGTAGCWNCDDRGEPGSTPAIEGLPGMTWGSSRANYTANGENAEEDFRL